MEKLRQKAIKSLLEEGMQKLVRTELMIEILGEIKPKEEQQEQVKQAFVQQQANKDQLEKEMKRLSEMLEEK